MRNHENNKIFSLQQNLKAISGLSHLYHAVTKQKIFLTILYLTYQIYRELYSEGKHRDSSCALEIPNQWVGKPFNSDRRHMPSSGMYKNWHDEDDDILPGIMVAMFFLS